MKQNDVARLPSIVIWINLVTEHTTMRFDRVHTAQK
jgi:hypothetical protein